MSLLKWVGVGALLLLSCGCGSIGLTALMNTKKATEAKPTVIASDDLRAVRKAAIVGVCHMREMGYFAGTRMKRMKIDESTGDGMRASFHAGFADALAPTSALSLDAALAKAPPLKAGHPAHATCEQMANPFANAEDQGPLSSIEPTIDLERMKAAAEALDVDAVFAVMMVPALEFQEGKVRMYSYGVVHSTVYGVDRSGKLIFQQALKAAGEAPGRTDAAIAKAGGVFGRNLALELRKSLASAR